MSSNIVEITEEEKILFAIEIEDPEKFYNKEKKLYICIKCNFSSPHITNMKKHLDSLDHNNSIEYKRRRVKQNKFLYDNYYDKNLKMFICKRCDFENSKINTISRHVKGEQHKTIGKKELLNIDEFFDEKEQKYICKKCNYSTEDEYCMRRHTKSEKHILDSEELKERRKQNGHLANQTGEETELFILNLLKELNFENVIHSGYYNSFFDILVKLKDEDYYRGIQVKTLQKNKTVATESYGIDCQNKNNYQKDTLILSITKDRSMFCSLFFNELGNSPVIIMNKIQNWDKLSLNIDDFKNKIIESVNKSTIIKKIEDTLAYEHRMEYEMVLRLIDVCKLYGLEFIKNTSNLNEIDGYIGKFRIQLKCSSVLSSTILYSFHIGRKENGIQRPYNENDQIDFFIFEIIDFTNKGNFYIIPKFELIERGYISTKNDIGKIAIVIPGIGGLENHWMKKYYNNFQLLKNNKIEITEVIRCNLHRWCIDYDLKCSFSDRNYVTYIGKCKIRHIHLHFNDDVEDSDLTKATFTLHINEDNIQKRCNISDKFDFYIFDFAKKSLDEFYVIPEKEMIERNILVRKII
jgi:hypothetical protein